MKCRYFIHIYKTSHILPENCSSDIVSTSLQQRQSMYQDSSSILIEEGMTKISYFFFSAH